MKLLDLFSGIGGFSLGLERAGFKTVAFCEIEPFCRAVLAKHWPEVPCYDDIRSLTGARLAADGIAFDAVCGGFPCQDISIAGRGVGLAGARSGLWREYARIIGECRPRLAIIENVAALRNRGGDQIAADLAGLGFDFWPFVVGAAHAGGNHYRARSFLVAYARGQGLPTPECARWSVAEQEATQVGQAIAERAGWTDQPGMGRVVHGVPGRVDRIRALGNSVCPPVAEILGRAVMAGLSR